MAWWIGALACLIFVASIPSSEALTAKVREPVDAISRTAPRGGRLTIRVLSRDDGTAVGQALARVFWQHEERYYLAAVDRVDSAGELVLEGLPRGQCWVLVEAPGRARSSTQLVLGGEPRVAEVRLGPAHSLRVQVVDETSAPVAEATVLVEGADTLPFGALTTEEGWVRLDRLGESPWSVRVAARGYEPAGKKGVEGDLTVTLHRQSGLAVRVEDTDGEPVGGATVLIAGSGLWPVRSTRTNDGGRARISGLDPGVYQLKAKKGGLVSATRVGVRVDPGVDDGLTLVLEPGVTVTAVVTDGDDEEHPVVVPGADVVLVEEGLSAFPLYGRADTLGKVTLGPIFPGPAVLAARADGFVPRGAVSVPPDSSDTVRVPLLRGATLTGTVVDREGRPVDGASIEVIGVDTDGLPIAETPATMAFRRSHFDWAFSQGAPLLPGGELGVMSGPIPPIPGSAGAPVDLTTRSLSLGESVSEATAFEPWVTAFDGTFSATPVTPGRVRALVRHPSYVEELSDAVTLGPGGRADVRVVLSEGGVVEGRVVDDLGLVVASVRVDLTAVKGTLHRTTLTAADGSFAFAAVPREVVIALARPNDLSRLVYREPVTVPANERTELELELPKEREPVTVAVVDEDERPIEMAQVTVLSIDARVPRRETDFTDAEGRVEVDDARGLGLRVVVSAAGHPQKTLEVDDAPERIDVTLELGVPVEGMVTAVRGRSRVEGARVEISTEGRRRTGFTDALGRYRFDDVAPGRATIRVQHGGYAVVERDVTVEPTGRADRAFELPSIDLAESATIAGVVEDSAGEPVSGARVGVGVVPAFLPMGAMPEGIARTDSKGRFVLEGVAAGAVTLQAYAVDVGRGTVALEADPGERVENARIVLHRGPDEVDPGTTGNVAVTLGERGSGRDLEVLVVVVAERSEAEHGGLRPGDVILAIDDVEPRSMADARQRLSGPEGSDVVVSVLRGQREMTLRLRRERVRR